MDMAALRQGLERHEYLVAWQAGTEQLADPLTKRGADVEALKSVFMIGESDVIFNRHEK